MKRKPNSLVTEVESLVEDCTVSEASNKVLQHLEKALQKLDPDNLELLKAYFECSSTEDLCAQRNIPPKEFKNWIDKTKRTLIHELRNSIQTKH